MQHLARCTSTFRGIPVAYDIVKLISELNASTKCVYLQWIPSHSGIVENDIVDELAKQACTAEGVLVSTKPFYSECLFTSKNVVWNCGRNTLMKGLPKLEFGTKPYSQNR